MTEVPPIPSVPLSTETQLALINQKLDMLVQTTADRGRDHEDRLRKLEQFKWLLVGIAAAAGGGAGAGAASLFK
jgi:hypothetical protein